MFTKISKLLLLSLLALTLSCESNSEDLELENSIENSNKTTQLKEKSLSKASPPISLDYVRIELINQYFGEKRYLSTTRNGDIVDLYPIDDGSGRQRWRLYPKYDNIGGYHYYNIVIYSGVRPRQKAFLSTTWDGGKIDLHDRDDGSGRQRWLISDVLSGGGREIRLVGGVVPHDETLLVRHKVGNNYTTHVHLEKSGSYRDSRWIIYK